MSASSTHPLSLIAVLALALALPACGGGGGDPSGPGNESIFEEVAFDAATTDGVFNATEALAKMGDNTSNDGRRILLRFDMPTLPAGASVVGAFLHFRTGSRVGIGSNELGKMRFVRTDFQAGLSSADYNTTELAHDEDSDFLVSPEDTPLRIGVLALYQSAVSASDTTLDIRIQYENESDNDNAEDSLEIVMLNHPTLEAPRLEIVYELP